MLRIAIMELLGYTEYMAVYVRAVLAAFLLVFSACSEGLPDFFVIKEGKLIDPGPNMSFFVKLNVSSNIAGDFTERLLTVQDQDEDKDGQIGRSYKVGERYMMTLPASYIEKDVRYVVEFTKTNSAFDNLAIIRNGPPIVLDWLKSRYYVAAGKIPKDGKEISLCIEDAGNLNMGYGPGGILLSDIPGAPLIYFLQFDLDAIKDYGFEVVGGAATVPDSDLLSLLISPGSLDSLEALNDVLGVMSVEYDGILVMTERYTAGDPFTLWFFMRKIGNSTLCPCGMDCSCKVQIPGRGDVAYCIYNPSSSLPSLLTGMEHTFAKIDIAKPVNKENEPLETGATINITVTEASLIGCGELLKALGSPLSLD
jgi:hypothetical protein